MRSLLVQLLVITGVCLLVLAVLSELFPPSEPGKRMGIMVVRSVEHLEGVTVYTVSYEGNPKGVWAALGTNLKVGETVDCTNEVVRTDYSTSEFLVCRSSSPLTGLDPNSQGQMSLVATVVGQMDNRIIVYSDFYDRTYFARGEVEMGQRALCQAEYSGTMSDLQSIECEPYTLRVDDSWRTNTDECRRRMWYRSNSSLDARCGSEAEYAARRDR